MPYAVYGKPYGRVSSILLMLTSRSDSFVEHSHISFYESKLDDGEPNSNGLDDRVRKKLYGFWQTLLCTQFNNLACSSSLIIDFFFQHT